MPRQRTAVYNSLVLLLAGCASAGAGYAVRPVAQIAADGVGESVLHLQETFGEPRKIDRAAANPVYVWFFAQSPDGAPAGLHGCEMEVTVDARSQRVLGYALSNIGWARCRDVERRIRVATR